jgi:GDP-mannose 6-dehydrogenase
MKVLVWGLGYVGTVSAGCLAREGHDVIGIEPHATKVAAVNRGESPVKEPRLDGILRDAVRAGRLRAIEDGRESVAESDISLVCVGTPTAGDGSPSLEFICAAVQDIAAGLRTTERYHTVVIRSTLMPGTTRETVAPLLQEVSGRSIGQDFGLASNPEFLREASAVDDYYAPPYTVVGQWDSRSGDAVAELYQSIDAPLHRVTLEDAELLKLVNNAFHALKIGFANEVGRVCSSLGIDSHAVMRLVCADNKLNISPRYLRPGFAFGGSCLPKDLRALVYQARRRGVQLPITEGILPSNRLQIDAACAEVHETGASTVAVLGLSFKPGTDDLRESPSIELVRRLWQDGLDVRVHDPDVCLETMLGSNRTYLHRQLPQIQDILCADADSAVAGCDAVVVSHDRPEFAAAVRRLPSHVAVVDLVRLRHDANEHLPGKRGLSWPQPVIGAG